MFEYQNDSCLSQIGVNIVCLFALVPIFGDVLSMNTYQTVCLVYFGSGIRYYKNIIRYLGTFVFSTIAKTLFGTICPILAVHPTKQKRSAAIIYQNF